MATSVTWFDRWLGKSGVETQAGEMAQAEARRGFDNKLRPFPNEDVHFFTKRIDNSRVIRQEDPQAPRTCWKMIGGASASAALLICMMLPSGYRLMAGYQIEELKKEREKLERSKAELELEEAKLLSPERLAQLADLQEFVDPHPSRIVHLSEKSDVTVAMRRTPATPAPVAVRPAAAVVQQPTAEPALEAETSVEIPQ